MKVTFKSFPSEKFNKISRLSADSDFPGLTATSKGALVELSGRIGRESGEVSIRFGAHVVSAMPRPGDTAWDAAKALRKNMPAGYGLAVVKNGDKVTMAAFREINSAPAVKSDLSAIEADGKISKAEIERWLKAIQKDGVTPEEKGTAQDAMRSRLDLLRNRDLWGKGAREAYISSEFGQGLIVNRSVAKPPSGG